MQYHIIVIINNTEKYKIKSWNMHIKPNILVLINFSNRLSAQKFNEKYKKVNYEVLS